MKHSGPSEPAFDQYASDYDAALTQGIAVSGESKDFFAEGRIAWLARLLPSLDVRPVTILDFGCGTGTNVPYLLKLESAAALLGVDISQASLDAARAAIPDSRARFAALDSYVPKAECDLAFTNGVFHHIPPAERAAAIGCMYRALRPGGILAFWENNPWNPGTHYVMSRIPFDRDAIKVSAPQARRLAEAAGFEVLRTDFLFVFPHLLRMLRAVEPWLVRLPLGAQYQMLCRKPVVY